MCYRHGYIILAECEFNVDFCQWANDPEADFDWSLSRGSLWTNTGPLRDQLSSQHNFNFGTERVQLFIIFSLV